MLSRLWFQINLLLQILIVTIVNFFYIILSVFKFYEDFSTDFKEFTKNLNDFLMNSAWITLYSILNNQIFITSDKVHEEGKLTAVLCHKIINNSNDFSIIENVSLLFTYQFIHEFLWTTKFFSLKVLLIKSVTVK